MSEPLSPGLWSLRERIACGWGYPRSSFLYMWLMELAWRTSLLSLKHQKYLFFFPSYKCNECEGVDANLDPGYILSSLKFCFINCNTGSCFVECCILNHRQPDNEYWRKGILN